jgi:hypothetical protein
VYFFYISHAASDLVGPFLYAFWFILGFTFLDARISGKAFNPGLFWRRCSRNVHVLFLLFLFLSLPGILRSSLYLFERPDHPVVTNLLKASDFLWNYFCILWVLLLPLLAAVSVKGWGVRETFRFGPAFYRRWAGPLLWMIPLFILPLFLFRVVYMILASQVGLHKATFLPIIFFGIGSRIFVPLFSIFPLCYLYRLAAWDESEPGQTSTEPSPSGVTGDMGEPLGVLE